MRHELEHLVGKRVHATGHIINRRRGYHGESQTCVKKCSIMLWDHFKTGRQNFRRKPDAKTDHLWLIYETEELCRKFPSFTADGERFLPLYAKGRFFGTIQRYTRADGTQDIGIAPTIAVKFSDIFVGQVERFWESGQYKELIQAVNDLEGSGASHFIATAKCEPTQSQ